MKTTIPRLSLFAIFLATTSIAMATPHTAPVRSLEIPPINAIIAADGDVDAAYGPSQSTTAFNVTGADGASADYTMSFQVCYDYQKLYMFFTVLDDYIDLIPLTTSSNPHNYDNVEVFLSIDTIGTIATYDSNTIQLRFNAGLTDSVQSPGRATQEEYSLFYEATADGFIIEVGIPWTAVLQEGVVDPDEVMQAIVVGGVINGFDVHGNDNDTDGPDARDCQVAWDDDDPAMPDATEDLAWNDRTKFGIMSFSASYGTPYIELNHDLAKFKPQLFPDPAGDNIHFKNIEPASMISIYNIMGAEVMKAEQIAEEESIDISRLGSGTYIVVINNYETLRFVKE